MLDSFTVFRGSNGTEIFLRSSLHRGTPETGTTMPFFIFSKTGCRGIIQGKTPPNFVVKLDQQVLEFSCSRQTRSENAIFVLESSSLRFHRGKARFIAQTRNPSRRFEEVDPEFLHRCSMGHDAKSFGGGFRFFVLLPILRGPN